MKPSISILDARFQYRSSIATSVADTWRRFGWRSKAELSGPKARSAIPATKLLPAPGAILAVAMAETIFRKGGSP